MRKKYLLFFAVLMLCPLLRNSGRRYTDDKHENNMELCYNFSISYDTGTIEYIAVIVRQPEITDHIKCAEEIIEHCIKNDFDNIKFYYNTKRYPCELHATVYLDKKDFDNGNYIFKMTYKQDPGNNLKYNIVENPEKFHLEIKELVFSPITY